MFFKKKKDEGADRRGFPRLFSRNLVKIMRQDGTPIERLSNIFDLSEGGVRVVCYENFPLGTPLQIVLNLPEAQTSITATAKIVWIRPIKKENGAYFAGVSFDNISESDKQILRRLIQENTSGPEKE